jgi:hypothetical protein
MTTPAAERVYWGAWFVATLLTGLAAGFMLGHALILAPFLDWLLERPAGELLSRTYAAFRASSGRVGLDVYYAVAGLQVLAAIVFGALALLTRRHRGVAMLAGAAGVGWVLVHYASGFGTIEAAVVRSRGPVPAELARHFLVWNRSIHFLHAAALTVAMGALLTVPLAARRRRQ